jgi:hypothetical protein
MSAVVAVGAPQLSAFVFAFVVMVVALVVTSPPGTVWPVFARCLWFASLPLLVIIFPIIPVLLFITLLQWISSGKEGTAIWDFWDTEPGRLLSKYLSFPDWYDKRK